MSNSSSHDQFKMAVLGKWRFENLLCKPRTAQKKYCSQFCSDLWPGKVQFKTIKTKVFTRTTLFRMQF